MYRASERRPSTTKPCIKPHTAQWSGQRNIFTVYLPRKSTLNESARVVAVMEPIFMSVFKKRTGMVTLAPVARRKRYAKILRACATVREKMVKCTGNRNIFFLSAYLQEMLPW